MRFPLPQDVEQVLIGSLLGDGHISKKSCRFEEIHSTKQLPYLKWKANILSKHFGGVIRSRVIRSRDKKEVRYRSKVHPHFASLRVLWYPNGKKVIPEGALEQLDSLGLSIWYQDDGSYQYYNKKCYIAVFPFTNQLTQIKSYFESLGFQVSIGKYVQFSPTQTNHFLKLIAPYALPCMRYKFGPIFAENEEKSKLHLDRRRKHWRERWRNDPEFRKRQLGWRKNNPKAWAHHLEYNRIRYWRKRDLLLAQKKRWYNENREKILARRRVLRRDHIEVVKIKFPPQLGNHKLKVVVD